MHRRCIAMNKNKTPAIQDYATPLPMTADESMGVLTADDLISRHKIRHLPVMREEELIGVVSDKEIAVALAFPGPGELTLHDIFSKRPYTVRAETPLDDVLFEMEQHKHSCAIVVDDRGRPLAIFTDSDALRGYRELLRNTYFSSAA